MRFKKLSVIVLFCSVIMITSSDAATGWLANLTINGLFVHGDCYIIDTDSTEGVNCTRPSRFTIKKESSLSTEMYITALSAMLKGKKINVYIPNANDCYGDGTVITYLGINNG